MDTHNKCTGCGRSRQTCWALPCLKLETAMATGIRAVKDWAGPQLMVVKIAKGGRRVDAAN